MTSWPRSGRSPRGDALPAPSVTRQVIAEFGHRRPHRMVRDLARLSEREREVLLLVARGRSNAEIAAELVIGEATVKTHLSSVSPSSGYATGSRPSSPPTSRADRAGAD